MAYDETPGQRDGAGKPLEEETSSSPVRSSEPFAADGGQTAAPESSSSAATGDEQWRGATDRGTESSDSREPELTAAEPADAAPAAGSSNGAAPDAVASNAGSSNAGSSNTGSSNTEFSNTVASNGVASSDEVAPVDVDAGSGHGSAPADVPSPAPARPSGPPSPWARSAGQPSGDQSPTEQLPTGTLNPTAQPDAAPGGFGAGQPRPTPSGYAGTVPQPVPSGYPAYQPVTGYPAYSAPGGPQGGLPGGPQGGPAGGQPGLSSFPGSQPPPGAVLGSPGHGGPPMYGPPTTPQPAAGGAAPRESSRRKLLIAGVVLALLAALFGGGLGGMVGYQFAANGGHLSVLDGPTPDADSAAAPEGAVEQIAQRTLPSVVQLRVTAGQQAGAGSGMVLSPDGLILTNNHVISMAVNGGTVNVLFQDGRITPAKIIGRNKTFDIAVVQAQGVSGLQPIKLGNSDSVRVGQSVVAIGSPLGLGGTVTSGIVSALNRAVSVGGDDDGPDTPAPPGLPPGLGPNTGLPNPNAPPDSDQDNNEVLNAIQTDASINPGNSGGPLVDLDGNVVGMNTAIASLASSGQGGSVGLGFSTPINQVKRVAQELQNTGKANKAVIGVKIETRPQTGPLKGTTQAAVVEITPGSPASQSALKAGDVIAKVDQRTVTSANEVVAAVLSHAPGDKVTLTLSDGRSVDIVLGSQPSN
ncbi:MAG TPA: trypsin-like peptidase domain-containing protein [Pseudonocardia sp.]|nr:trypsin-like peptidase domain-containing protein [Pseudonocardia sp.]